MEDGGGGVALWLPLGSTVSTRDGSGTEGRTPGSQLQWGQDCVTLTVCTKGLTWEAGKHSQYSSTGIMAEASPPIQGTVGGKRVW